MAAAKPKKPGDGIRARYGKCIPRGDDFLPGVDTGVLRKMHKELSGRKDIGKDALIIAAAIKWREWFHVSEIARQMIQPRSTIHDWLVRLRDRGLDGILDRTAPNHKPILGEIRWIVIGVWLSHAPQAYGFESGLWQASMVCKMILDRHGIDIRPRTLRATLYRMNLSFRIPRDVPHKSADAETCKKFIEDTQKRMGALARVGYTNFYEDEMTMLLAALTGRGWLRTRRTRDYTDHILQEVAEGEGEKQVNPTSDLGRVVSSALVKHWPCAATSGLAPLHVNGRICAASFLGLAPLWVIAASLLADHKKEVKAKSTVQTIS